MRSILVIFDSLNRGALEAYGGVCATPNFARFAARSVTFDTHYVGSLPCMPARRDLQTGRLNFLHRSWGPLEPFDLSCSEILKVAGAHTHLITDHYHYWEDGGATYHNRFSTWEFLRGQEWDPWQAWVEPPTSLRDRYHAIQQDGPNRLQGMINREYIVEEEDYSLVQCFNRALHFLDRNRDADHWLLQLECFDPHEPFHAPERFRKLYPTDYNGPILDWPKYRRVEEGAEEIAEIRANYAALVSMCDYYFGKLLDYFDAHDLWEDTALIVTTDHGYMLAEHDWWAKSRMPFYEEVSHIPLLVYVPEFARRGGERRQALTQTIDLMPTLLDIYGCDIPDTVEGFSLLPVLEQDQAIRTAAIYGRFGAATNVTDGRYTYFRYPEDMENQQLWEYTLMPTHQRALFAKEEFEGVTLERSFAFLRGFPVLKLPAGKAPIKGQGAQIEDARTVLYDLNTDPRQMQPLQDAATEGRLQREMQKLMHANEAPPEAYRRLGLVPPTQQMENH